MQHAADLRITADDGVDLAATREGRQVRAILLQGLVLLLRVLVRDALVAAHLLEGLQVFGLRETGGLQRAGELIRLPQRGQHHMLHAQVVILHLLAHLLRRRQQRIQLATDAGALRHRTHLPRYPLQQPRHLGGYSLRDHTGLLQHGGQHPALLIYQRQQKLRRHDLRTPR